MSTDDLTHPILRRLCSTLDIDADWIEAFLPYLDILIAIGINFEDELLQQAIEAYPVRIGTACQCLIDYAGYRASQNRRFESPQHATRCLTRAFHDNWQLRPDWQCYRKLAPNARHVSAYEYAHCLITLLNTQPSFRAWKTTFLDGLSDESILQIIPELERYVLESGGSLPDH